MSQDIENTRQLGSINQKVVADGESLPAVRLKDGSRVQTGTVATMLHNIALYNLQTSTEEQRRDIEQELLSAIPTLVKVGLFDLFSPDEWGAGDNPGRKFVGECAKAYFAGQTTDIRR